MDKSIHHRRSTRLKGFDYAQTGMYFVTLVTWQCACLFGEIAGVEMRLNDLGFLVAKEWQRLSLCIAHVIVDEFLVMPDHLHGLLTITDYANSVVARQADSILSGGSSLASPLPASLGAIVGSYKSTTSSLINGLRHTPGAPVWQRNYYDHIIRNDVELQRVRAYIHNNPYQWDLDRENPTQW